MINGHGFRYGLSRTVIVLLCGILSMSCNESKKEVSKNINMTDFKEAPQWAKEAIWYQIFVERFRSGSEGNKPTLETMKGALIDEVPASWSVTPWGHNWYAPESWTKETKLDFYRTIQMRRYGGDLQGVMDKIPYLKDLGINAVYFNPLNDAPSLHKYDARSYHHIDVCFGNDRDGDMKLMAEEDPSDPSKWVWTNADKLFVELIQKLHKSGIKVVLDFSWNHTGREFWAFKDIMKNGTESRFKDWYEIKQLDDKLTPENEFDYEGWFGIKSLPELKKIKETEKHQGYAYEGNMPEVVKQHIFAVCKRWMDPNGDGNPADGIDGMRLDVAEHVPLGFWRDLRKYTRSVNPDFYLVGENWWTKWPDELMDAEPWVRGDVFDAVMHYQWFRPARAYFNQGDDKIDLTSFYKQMEFLFSKYRPGTQHAMMNLVSSHDSERILSALYNTNKYKFHSKPAENPHYKSGKPDAVTYKKLYALLLHQFTFVGSPHIWNGDEMGMWGADDPDNRKPLIWEDIEFDEETPIAPEYNQYKDKPVFNKEVFNFYKSMCNLRNNEKALRLGVCEFDKSLLGANILAYKRVLDDDTLVVLINSDGSSKQIEMSQYKGYKTVYNLNTSIDGEHIKFNAYAGVVLKK